MFLPSVPSDGLKLFSKLISPIITMAKTLRQDITGLRAIAVLAVTLFPACADRKVLLTIVDKSMMLVSP